jgi:exodeoxyribonuclease V beta subunit
VPVPVPANAEALKNAKGGNKAGANQFTPTLVANAGPPARYTPPAEAPLTLAPREFARTIPRDWRISSFSTLTRTRLDEEQPDYDRVASLERLEKEDAAELAAESIPAEAEPAAGIFAFPRGSGPGTCWHKIFEALDFTNLAGTADGGNGLEQVVQRELEARGLAASWANELGAAVRRTLSVPLTTPTGTTFTLDTIRLEQRLTELEFQFPAALLTPELFQKTLGTVAAVPNFGAWLARLGFRPVRGFLKGYIDLVFEFEGRYYLLDWKSNWLGNRVEDYSPERLPQTMAEHYYALQYHLYTVALHLYLKRRMAGYDYDQHFGGVYYLFLRGLDPARPQFGVFQARPTFQTTNALAQSLLDTSMT